MAAIERIIMAWFRLLELLIKSKWFWAWVIMFTFLFQRPATFSEILKNLENINETGKILIGVGGFGAGMLYNNRKGNQYDQSNSNYNNFGDSVDHNSISNGCQYWNQTRCTRNDNSPSNSGHEG